MFETVLFALDGSRESHDAIATVAKLVKTCNSRLVVVSVVEPAQLEEQPEPRKTPEALAQLLETVRDLFTQKGIKTEAIEREGKPSFTICDIADEIEADLIVMGTRGLGLTDEGAADSVTNRVISLSPCPVLIVP